LIPKQAPPILPLPCRRTPLLRLAARWAAAVGLAWALVAGVPAIGQRSATGGDESSSVTTLEREEEAVRGEGRVLGQRTLASPTGFPDESDELTGIEAAEVGVLKHWFNRRNALARGDEEEAALEVKKLEALMDREGINGMEVLAAAFAHEGFYQFEAGNYRQALDSFQLALRFDPSLPNAHIGLARARRIGPCGPGRHARDCSAPSSARRASRRARRPAPSAPARGAGARPGTRRS